MRRLRARVVALVLAALGVHCAHRHAAPSVALGPEQQQAARARLQTRPAPPPLWAANGLLVAYGHGERLRTRVQMLVRSPQQFA